MYNKKLLIVELNEFSKDLLKDSSSILNLKNIKKLLKMKNSETTTMERKEHHGLDPWVQWVSIHTGVPNKMHKIDHLAEVKNLKYPQIWDVLDQKGFSSGIWGIMNSSLKGRENCRFFFPDPWTFSEKAFPKKINNYLDLPRYFAKNYVKPSLKKLFFKSFKLLKFIIFDINIFYLRKEIIYSIFNLLKLGLLSPKDDYQYSKSETYRNILFSSFDLISTKIFLKYKKVYDPDISIIFLNSLAHAQHGSWKKHSLNKNMIYTLKTIDNILGLIFQQERNNDALLIINGLGQKNVDGEDYYAYRQIDPEKFIRKLGLKYNYLEQCMTSESHIFFYDLKELEKAFNLLKNAQINEKKLFFVEKDQNKPNKLFYQIDYFNFVKKDSFFEINGNYFDFYKFFTILAKRTGAHIPIGNAYYKNIKIKKSIYNHEIFDEVLSFFEN